MMILILHLFLKHGKTFTHKCFYTLMILQLSGQPSGSADQRISGPGDQRISGSADQRTSGSSDQPSRGNGSADELVIF